MESWLKQVWPQPVLLREAFRVRIPSHSKVALGATGTVLAFVSLLVGLASVLIHQGRESALNAGSAQIQRFAKQAEFSFNRSLLSVDVLLSVTAKTLNVEDLLHGKVNGEAFAQQVQGTLNQNQLINRILVVDPHGQLLAASDTTGKSSGITLPKSFVADVLLQPVSSLVISSPTSSTTTTEPVLLMGRLLMVNASTRVVVVAEVPINRLSSLQTNGSGIEDLQTTLERSNGDLLASSPLSLDVPRATQIAPIGISPNWNPTQSTPARVTGEPAIVATRKTLYGNLYLTASIPITSVLRDWVRDERIIQTVTLAMSILATFAGVFAVWYLRKVAETQATLGKAKEALDLALESMESGFVQLDPQRNVVNWNQRFIDLHHWLAGHVYPLVSFQHLMQLTAAHLLPHAANTERMAWVSNRMALLEGQTQSRQVEDPDGTMIEITERASPDGGVVIVYQDITRLRSAMANVELLAFYDPLTNLPNRRLLNDRLQQGIHTCLRTQHHGALLFLDLDHFKTLNDTAGHVVGDELLQQVAARLKSCVRDEDTVARFGGDEFVVMLQSLSPDHSTASAQAAAVGENILSQLNQPYTLLGTEYRCTCSVGATLFGSTPQDAHELLKQADIAMYQVKGSGRNALCFFDPNMLAAITTRSNLERDLRQAISSNQMTLYFQVQVADSGRPVGAEVLIRWNHPERGLVPPNQFIGLAEESGLIHSLGEWVLHTACHQLRTWSNHPQLSRLQLAVNVSARQFRSNEFVGVVREIVTQTRIDPSRLKLELTESLVLHNIADTIQKMQTLKQLGVQFAMDDFGTGYSSLAYLTELPLDQLKVDQSFVRNIGVKATDAAVIDTIIGLGRSLGIEVIAEGVETVEQRDFLAQHGCGLCQGYLFGRPVPLEEFESQFTHVAPWETRTRRKLPLQIVS